VVKKSSRAKKKRNESFWALKNHRSAPVDPLVLITCVRYDNSSPHSLPCKYWISSNYLLSFIILNKYGRVIGKSIEHIIFYTSVTLINLFRLSQNCSYFNDCQICLLLFVLSRSMASLPYINDLPGSVRIRVRLFADNITVFWSHNQKITLWTAKRLHEYLHNTEWLD